MSVSARNWAWDAMFVADGNGEWRRIRTSEKLTLLSLAEHENADYGYAFPGQARISEFTSLDERTIRRALEVLIPARAVMVDSAHAAGSPFAHNVYWLNVPESFRVSDPGWMKRRAEGSSPFTMPAMIQLRSDTGALSPSEGVVPFWERAYRPPAQGEPSFK